MFSRLRRRLPLILFMFLFVVPFVFGVVNAQNQESDVEKQQQFSDDVNSENANLNQTVDGVVEATMRALSEDAGYCVGENCQKNGVSAINGMSRLIGQTFNYEGISTQAYIADVMDDMSIAPAHAQGLGFSSLRPVLELWKIFRNLAYVFFVLIFLVIGFAIMFRQNLGGQAAVTVQQALPKIIVALLMVTFSYAIAGLLIDLMYVVMFFLVAMFGSTGLYSNVLTDFGDNGNILSQNVFQIYVGIITGGFAQNAGNVVGRLVDSMLSDSGIAEPLTDFAGGITGILGTLIIFFAILFAMFKTFFGLVKVYIEIIMTVVFAPIILMMGAVQSNAFGNWVKGLLANLAVFPALLVFIMIGYMLIGTESSILQRNVAQELNDGGFVPPFLPGRGSADTIGLIAGIGAIMLMSEVPAIMARFKPKSMFDDLGKMAWDNAMKGKKAGLATAGGIALGATAGVLGTAGGYWMGRRGAGGSRQRAAKYAAIGAGLGLTAPITARVAPKVIGVASRAGRTAEGLIAGAGTLGPTAASLASALGRKPAPPPQNPNKPTPPPTGQPGGTGGSGKGFSGQTPKPPTP